MRKSPTVDQRRRRGNAVGAAIAVLAGGLGVAIGETDELAQEFEKEIEPIFVNYCYDCHGDGLDKGEFSFEEYGSIEKMVANREIWKRVRDHIDFRLMPPPDEFAPADHERERLILWIDQAIFPVDPNNPDPGHVNLRRLNRPEYQNTVKDLLDVDVDVEVMGLLPADDSGYGFDNIADVLTLSPPHLERYHEAARMALDEAVDISPPKFLELVISGRQMNGEGTERENGRLFSSNGEAKSKLQLRRSGTYRIKTYAGADQGGSEPAKMEMRLNGEVLKEFAVENPKGAPEEFVVERHLEGGEELVLAVRFTNDHYDESAPEGKRDRNLYVDSVILEGPLDGSPVPKKRTHRMIFGERDEGLSDEAYMWEVLERFAVRAFRRPVHEGEIERYQFFLKTARELGESVEYAIRLSLEAMLISPSFLFREEPTEGEGKGGKILIDEFALASRLSYFLWSTMPDARLLELARMGELRANLGKEIKRMLTSGKSEALVENFVGQWLQLRDMDAVVPDRRKFPEFDRQLADDMRRETEELVKHVIKENQPVHTLLDADFTFINERLAKHYRIEGVKGSGFRRVSLQNNPRRGLLGHGSVLTLTSFPMRTSPVLRGKYVLENILNTPPPPPPPNIDGLETDPEDTRQTSLREQLVRHRSDPNCSSCHALMDPIGFGLENFDAIGRWRTEDRGMPLEVADKLVTGQSFTTGEELRTIIANDYRDEFYRSIATKLLTYAIGRGLDYYDRPAVDKIVFKAKENDARFVSLVEAIVDSVPFQYRRK